MSAYMKCFEEANCISFLVKDEDLLGKHNEYGMRSVASFEDDLIMSRYMIVNTCKIKLKAFDKKKIQIVNNTKVDTVFVVQ